MYNLKKLYYFTFFLTISDSRVALQISVLPRIAPPRGRTRVGKSHWKFNTNESVEGILVHVTVSCSLKFSR